MAAPVNDRDVLILNADTRDTDPRGGKYVRLSASTVLFHVNVDGSPVNTSSTLTALGINLGATATWAVTSGTATLTGTAANVRTLTFANMTSDVVEITATMVEDGQTYTDKITVSKVQDGAVGKDGTPGISGTQYATAFLYKWSTAATMTAPTGSTTFTWSNGANTAYVGTDGWYVIPPANPGTAGIKLWVASRPISAVGGTETSNVTYTADTTVSAFTQNGAKGDTGAAGVKSALLRAYKWDNSGIAPTATGTGTFTYSTNDYNNLPATGWSKTKPEAPGVGFTLYEASVNVVNTTGATTTNFDWATAVVVGVGYIGTNGAPGVTGDSAMIAYTLVDGNSLAATPATKTEAGKAKPTIGTWGETRAWVDQPPTPAANQAVFQSNGIYNSALDRTIWGVPYLSNLRVGSLSALSANLGAITAGSMNIGAGKFIVSENGDVVAKSISIQKADGTVILEAGTPLHPDYAAPGTKNSELSSAINSAASTAVWGSITGTGKPASNATVGAPSGTNVGDQSADTVATAVKAVNNATTGLASKLKNGDDVLKGVLSVDTTYSAGLRVGTLTWGTNGVRTGGYGVAVTPAGLVGYKTDGTRTFYIDAATGDAVFAGTLAANTVTATSIQAEAVDSDKIKAGAITADKIKAGAITAEKLAVGAIDASKVRISSDQGNLVRDPQFREMAWWGFSEQQLQSVGFGRWADNGQNTDWKYGTSLYLYPTSTYNELVRTYTTSMPIVANATYLVEYQINFSGDFDGDLSIWLHTYWWAFNTLGALGAVPDSGYKFNGDGDAIQYPSNSRGFRNISFKVTVPNNTAITGCQFVIARQVRAGNCEIGGFNITRVTDSTLIKDGTIETKHLSIAQGGSINSGMTGFKTGRGFWLEGDGNGHVARFSIGSDTGGMLDWDGNTLTIKQAKTVTPFSATLPSIDRRSQANVSSLVTYTSLTPTMSNGVAPYQYSWSMSAETGTGGEVRMSGDPLSSAVSILGKGSNIVNVVWVQCRITDSTGAVATAGCQIYYQHGAGQIQ